MWLHAFALAVGLGGLAAGVLVFGEHPLASPGPISESHADFADDCRSCHMPFEGVATGCANCHDAKLHENRHAERGVACGSCHREHRADLEPAILRDDGADCARCHGEAAEIPAHGFDTGRMFRPALATHPGREHAEAYTTFSHEEHFEELEDTRCQTCHFLGARAVATSGDEDQLLRGCDDCHDSWADAGFADGGRRPFVALSLPRFDRLRFQHSSAHLDAADCGECHAGIDRAGAIAGLADTAPALELTPCFECHEPRDEAPCFDDGAGGCAERPVACSDAVGFIERADARSCVACHESHGSERGCDLGADPEYEASEARGSVWAELGPIRVTPWLALFLGLGGGSWAWAWRRLPPLQLRVATVNPDAAPQRVAEVPQLSPSFETSVPGLYIIGELAGVPLVNRAMKSGFDVIDFIADALKSEEAGDDDPERLDVLIAGSGPAGLGAATRAQHLGLRYVVCEKSTPAATILSFPRAKIVQAAPIEVPDYGSFFQEDDESKEGLVSRWEDIIRRTGVVLREREEVVRLEADGDAGFEVEVRGGSVYRARKVVLAIGMRGTPRRLNVPGEDVERVHYSLIDPDEFREQQILVVGGGNVGVEAALALSEPALLNRVTFSYRKPILSGVTTQNSKALDEAAAEGRLIVLPNSKPVEISEHSVRIATAETEVDLDNDAVFVMIGAELPTRFLKAAGIKLVRKGGL